MPRRKYDLKEMMSDVFGGKENTDDPHLPPPSAHPHMDMSAPVLSLGQYPIAAENGEPHKPSVVSIVKGRAEANGGESNKKISFDENGHERESGKSSPVSDDGEDNETKVNGKKSDGNALKSSADNSDNTVQEALQLILDVRAQSDFAFYARRIPGLVNILV